MLNTELVLLFDPVVTVGFLNSLFDLLLTGSRLSIDWEKPTIRSNQRANGLVVVGEKLATSDLFALIDVGEIVPEIDDKF